MLARHQAHRRREVAARRFAEDREPILRPSMFARHARRPTHGRPCVLEGRGKRMLGRESIVHVHHGQPRLHRQMAAHRVEAVAASHEPSAAMKGDDDAARGAGVVHAGGNELRPVPGWPARTPSRPAARGAGSPFALRSRRALRPASPATCSAGPRACSASSRSAGWMSSECSHSGLLRARRTPSETA